MTRICACRAALSEQQLFAASSIGVRIEHDAEPCLLGARENPTGETAGAEVRAYIADPRPVLTRLPRLTVVPR